MKAELKKQRIFYYDLIRAFSCLCIMTVHFNASVSAWQDGGYLYQNSITPNYFLGNRVYLGDIGVNLFFMLSGATLTMHYGDWKRFYIRRFQNIYPMFWTAYAIVFLIDFMNNKGMSGASLRLLPLTILGLDGYLATLELVPHGFYIIGEWFLGCIVLLYLLFPIFHAGMARAPLATVLGGTLLAKGMALLSKSGAGGVIPCTGVEPWFMMLEMLLGMLFVRYAWHRRAAALALILGGGVAAVYILDLALPTLAVSTLLCSFLFTLLTAVARMIQKLPVRSAIVRFAELSYPIFLLHHWLIDRMSQGFSLGVMRRRDMFALYAAYFAVTLAAAMALERLTAWIRRTLASSREECAIHTD